MANTARKKRRTRFLVDPKFQGYTLFWVFLLSMFVIVCLTAAIHLTLFAVQSGVMDEMKGTATAIVVTLGTALLAFVVVAGLYLSHRIAGPAMRFRHVLDSIETNVHPIPKVYLRKGDAMMDVAECVNRLIDRVEVREAENRHLASDILERLADLEKQVSGSDVAKSAEFGEDITGIRESCDRIALLNHAPAEA